MRKRWIVILASSLALAGCANMKNAGKEEEKEGDEVKVAFADCPAPVKAALSRESNNARIDSVDKETRDGKLVYEADAMVNGQNWEIVVDENGKVVSKKLDTEASEKKGEKEADEKHEKKEKADKD